MQNGVVPRQSDAPFSIHAEVAGLPDDAICHWPVDNVPHHLVRARSRRGDCEHPSVIERDRPRIGRLATTARIEAGPVKCDRVTFDAHYTRLRFEAVVIFPVKAYG